MEGIIVAILIGSCIIAWAIHSKSEKSDTPTDSSSYYPDYHERTDDEIRTDIIQDGINEGLLPIEIAENPWFKTESKVWIYAKQYGLDEKLNELIEKRKNNPNLTKEIQRDKLVLNIKEIEKSIKEEEEDFELAKQTNNFEEAKNSKEMLKFYKNDLEDKNSQLKEINKVLA